MKGGPFVEIGDDPGHQGYVARAEIPGSIGRKARRLYFLQGTHFPADPGARIGAYVVHYQDGTTAEIPTRYGQDVLDWWARPDAGPGPALSQIVWTGHNEAASRSGVDIRLFMKTWNSRI